MIQTLKALWRWLRPKPRTGPGYVIITEHEARELHAQTFVATGNYMPVPNSIYATIEIVGSEKGAECCNGERR